MYAPEHLKHMADAKSNPYEEAAGFVYDPKLTSRYFNLIRLCVKCFALDPLPELRSAWAGILAAGGPENMPEAMATFNQLPFEYHDLPRILNELSSDKLGGNVLTMLRQQRHWSETCRAQYREIEKITKRSVKVLD